MPFLIFLSREPPLPMPHWNTLSVPLKNGWQCTLVPVNDYRSPTGERKAFMPSEELKQLELDRRDFDWHFRPDSDLRTLSGNAALRTIQTFLSEILNVAHWNLPADNAGVQRMLREAAADGRLVPVINRERYWQSPVSRPTPAPLRWPANGGGLDGAGQKWAAFAAAGSRPLSFNGEPILSGPFDPGAQEAALTAARRAMAANREDSNLLSGLRGVVGAVSGMTDGAEGGDQDVAGHSAGARMLFSDAQPFEYAPHTPDGDREEVAARGVGLTGNEPGGYRINPNGLDVDYFDSKGNLCAQYHESHGEAHGHNFADGKRDNAHVRMSPINCR
ncbi:hypothetical protein RI103_23120 [Paraburkholderia sp. FT54]|uniref:hypothetical protein n=1 Tax=Paraburkholderia sp. FT54 TaxID=3074437 RepID=UPI00287730E9|nr:hypothetical protein [Paraburkholderia sp. FT54]WNC93682.1 hypothetical protein RI103_23120 [Paraburkholderia sp. FT54]